ncbi:aspartate aminotransferase family protein, partial [candidate division KSB1 bacterium]
MDTKEIIAEEQKYILSTYKRPSFVLERGEGMYLFDLEGNKYLDFVGGLAVNALGYGDKEVLAALNSQAEKLIHCSNLFHSIPGVKLAKLLIE